MSDTAGVSLYYRKKLEQHELTPEEWVAVRYAVIKHTAIGIVNHDVDAVSIISSIQDIDLVRNELLCCSSCYHDLNFGKRRILLW